MCELQWHALADICLRKQNCIEETRCLCSRVFIRRSKEGQLHFVSPFTECSPEEEDLTEEIVSNSNLTTVLKYKDKLEVDSEVLSCYCSASHTDTLSTDEHDSLRESIEIRPLVKGIQTSDSGADLTEYLKHDINSDWQKFWTINGEKLIWESWISKYSAYINPEYLPVTDTQPPQEERHLTRFETSRTQFSKFSFEDVDLQNYSVESATKVSQKRSEGKNKFLVRELSGSDEKINADVSEGWNPLSPLSIECETEVERLLSSRCGSNASSSLRTVDSMTNVTRMTVSSVDFNKSPSESLSSVSSVESSVSTTSSEEGCDDYEHQWNLLWKKHYEGEYLVQFDKFVSSRSENKNDISNKKCDKTKNKLKKHSKVSSKRKNQTVQTQTSSIEEEEVCEINSLGKLITNFDLSNNVKRNPNEDDDDTTMKHETETANEETAQLIALGLPVAFGKAKEEKCTNTDSKKLKSNLSPEDNFNCLRNRIKAAFNLLDIEYLEGKDLMSGEVDYKMKHIRLQNRHLKLRSESKRPRCDDDVKNVTERAGAACEENYHSILSDYSDDKLSSGEEDLICNETPTSNNRTDDRVEDNAIKRRKRKKKLSLPQEIKENGRLRKYWQKRFSLFSKFDEGIKLDEESWYSVTPEAVAKHTAERCKCDVIVDAFCGAGGNTIQFASTCKKVIAIDIDPKKIEIAQHNALIYGVGDNIEFIVGDFLKLAPSLKADVIFLSPPWGGPSYLNKSKMYDLEKMLLPVPYSKLLESARLVTDNIAVFLPKNSNSHDVITQAGPGGFVEIEQNFINDNLVAISVYYNNLIKKV